MRFDKGEQREVHRLIAQEIPALRRYAQVLMQGAGDKDDLVQDTLERALKKSTSWRKDGSIRSWLYRIQYTVFINRYRKRANLKEVSTDDVGENSALTVNPRADVKMECQQMLGALENLKPRQREVLLLIAVEGFSYDQVAQIMDIPVGTVRSRLARAREDLRFAMKQEKTAPVSANDVKEV